MTIMATAIQNLFTKPASQFSEYTGAYWMALFFGFIHGMGFANYFRALLIDETSIFIPLLGFNLGIELGQLIIVFFIATTAHLFTRRFRASERDWNVFISGAGFSLSLLLMLENKFW